MLDMNSKNIGAFAGNAAFFWFLAMIPLLMSLCAILPITQISEADLVRAVRYLVPDALRNFSIAVVSEIYEKSTGTITFFAIIALWSASRGMMTLTMGLNVVNEYIEKRNYIVIRMISTFYTFIMLVGIVIALGVSVFGKIIIDTFREFEEIYKFLKHISTFRFVVTGMLLVMIFTMAYTFLPAINLKIKTQIPGAILSAIVCMVASWGFSIYIENFGGFGTYGSLATVVIMMFWFYMLMYSFFFGAELNRYILSNAQDGKGWAEKIVNTFDKTNMEK